MSEWHFMNKKSVNGKIIRNQSQCKINREPKEVESCLCDCYCNCECSSRYLGVVLSAGCLSLSSLSQGFSCSEYQATCFTVLQIWMG